MNLRKLLNLPTAKQTIAIQDQVKTIMERCEKIGTQEYREQKENQRTHDGRCPKCRADNVIDRIASVEGKGKVDGSFYLGFGSVNGFSSVDTTAVNHCVACGHEWKKFKTKFISKTDMIRVTLRYLGNIIDNPVHNEGMSWKTDALKVFDGCSAEAVYILYKKHKVVLRTRVGIYVTLRSIRTRYSSIFDKDKTTL